MKGYISKFFDKNHYGFIHGEDDKDYFFLEFKDDRGRNIYTNAKEGHIVEFSIAENPMHKNSKAESIRKLATGTHHIYVEELERVKENLMIYMPNGEEKHYRIRDLNRIIAWLQHMPCVCTTCGSKIEPIVFKWEDDINGSETDSSDSTAYTDHCEYRSHML